MTEEQVSVEEPEAQVTPRLERLKSHLVDLAQGAKKLAPIVGLAAVCITGIRYLK